MTEIRLRKVEFTDAHLLMEWENDLNIQFVSDRSSPYSFQDILNLIASAQDLKTDKQIRYIIEKNASPIGTLDAFEYNEATATVGLGVLIALDAEKRKGYAYEAALQGKLLLKKYGIENFEATVDADNEGSCRLFEKLLFQKETISEKDLNFDSNRKQFKFSKCEK